MGGPGLLPLPFHVHGFTECVAWTRTPPPATASCWNVHHPFLNGLDSHWPGLVDGQAAHPASNSWLQGTHFRAGAANDGERRWQGGGRLLGWWVGVVGGQGHALVGWKVGLSSWGVCPRLWLSMVGCLSLAWNPRSPSHPHLITSMNWNLQIWAGGQHSVASLWMHFLIKHFVLLDVWFRHSGFCSNVFDLFCQYFKKYQVKGLWICFYMKICF